MASDRLLLVDDDEALRSGLELVLGASGFDVTTAPGAAEALRLIASQPYSQPYDVLLTDLHMPGPGDGLSVISAMRHINSAAVTLLLSADPNLMEAASAIVGQVDEVILKPVKAAFLVQRIRERLEDRENGNTRAALLTSEEIAGLIEEETPSIAGAWLAELERPGSRTIPPVPLSAAERSEHLPEALRDIVFRLRYPQPIGASTLFSMSALQHGARRRRQGIGAATLAEEARALQVALFRILEANAGRISPGSLGTALMGVADEVNAQLLQALQGYENEDPPEAVWGFR